MSVPVTYHCPYCGALTTVERDAYLDDKCVTREPLEGWEYAGTTENYEQADGIELVCLGSGDGTDGRPEAGANDPDPEKDGCGRTFYLSFVRFEGGEEVDHRTPDIDRPRFDFNA